MNDVPAWASEIPRCGTFVWRMQRDECCSFCWAVTGRPRPWVVLIDGHLLCAWHASRYRAEKARAAA